MGGWWVVVVVGVGAIVVVANNNSSSSTSNSRGRFLGGSGRAPQGKIKFQNMSKQNWGMHEALALGGA